VLSRLGASAITAPMSRWHAVVFVAALGIGCTKSEPTIDAPTASAPAPRASAASAAPIDAGIADSGLTACGKSPLPDCPLQAWMKANANPAVMAKDGAALGIVFDRIATLAPPAYPNWASISKDGAAAARSGDTTAAKAACRGCHDQYRAKYRSDLRSRPL
jgi:hypothetical protein